MPASPYLLLSFLTARLEFLYYLLLRTYDVERREYQANTAESVEQYGSSLTVLSQAGDGSNVGSVESCLYAVSQLDQESPSPRPPRRHRHQPQPQTPSSNSSNYRPAVIAPPASLASTLTTSGQPSSRGSPEHSLPIRTPRHTDSLVTMAFGPTFDVKRCFVQEQGNVHNVAPELAIPDEEMSTEVDIALLPSLESEPTSSLSSADWVSEHSVATPTEMRVHAPLPVWHSDQLMQSSEVGRLPHVRKRRAMLTVQAAGDLYEAIMQENCLIYAACRARPRRLLKKKSNVKWPAISVTGSYETTVSIVSMGGDEVVEEVSVSSRRRRRSGAGRFLRRVCRRLCCCLISEEKDFNKNPEACRR
ncbi:hypothetical protein SprV_0602076500 [Sparganum proliferum]